MHDHTHKLWVACVGRSPHRTFPATVGGYFPGSLDFEADASAELAHY